MAGDSDEAVPHSEILEVCNEKFLSVKTALKSGWVIGGAIAALLVIEVTWASGVNTAITEIKAQARSQSYVDSLMLDRMTQILTNQNEILRIYRLNQISKGKQP
jgi:hypothetical protein